MFTRVLFPTDFSPHAERIGKCLPELKALGASEIVLLNVIEVGHPIGFDSDQLERIIAWKKDAETRLQALRTAIEQTGIRVHVKIELGIPHIDILRIADEENVDLILMGTHGHGFVRGVTIGSVTHKVVQHARVPTLVLKQKLMDQLGTTECEFVCQHLLRRILLPTDFSATAAEAVRIVKGLRAAGGESVVLLHVLGAEKTKSQPAHLAEVSDRLERIKAELEFFGYSTTVVVCTGDAFKEIDRVTAEQNASLIVIGATGRSAAADVMLGSVSDAVVCRHARPVLVVRPIREEEIQEPVASASAKKNAKGGRS
jgi:nucleotide-binding universal stress UspA family protein